MVSRDMESRLQSAWLSPGRAYQNFAKSTYGERPLFRFRRQLAYKLSTALTGKIIKTLFGV